MKKYYPSWIVCFGVSSVLLSFSLWYLAADVKIVITSVLLGMSATILVIESFLFPIYRGLIIRLMSEEEKRIRKLVNSRQSR